MIKMKRKIKGVIALGMTLAMSLGMVGPVWAASADSITTSTTVDNLAGTGSPKTQYLAPDTTDSPTNVGSTDVYIDNAASYTIQVPKTIQFTNTWRDGKTPQEFTYGNTDASKQAYVTVTEASLAPLQTLTISVANVDLKWKGSTGEEKNSNYTLTAKIKEHAGTADYSSSCIISNTSELSARKINNDVYCDIQLVPNEIIYAGSYKGVMTFTATLSEFKIAH